MSGPPLTPRDLDAEKFDVANKRPRIVCQFHAKGWCIRGKSCKFLHIKEGLDAAGQKTVTTFSGLHMLPPQSRDNPANCQIGTSAIHKRDTLDGALEQAGNMPVGQNSRSMISQAGNMPVGQNSRSMISVAILPSHQGRFRCCRAENFQVFEVEEEVEIDKEAEEQGNEEGGMILKLAKT